MTKNFQLLLLLTMSLSGFAQDSSRFSRTNMYGEILGAGFHSLNIERLYFTESPLYFSSRIGLGIYPSKLGLFGGESQLTVLVPITFSIIYGKKFGFEAGYGLTLGLDNSKDAYDNSGPLKWFDGIIGMRYQKPGRGFLFRLGYTPWIRYPSNCLDSNCTQTEQRARAYHFIGVSFGWRIKTPIRK